MLSTDNVVDASISESSDGGLQLDSGDLLAEFHDGGLELPITARIKNNTIK